MDIFEPIANLGPVWVFIINLLCVIVGGIIGTIIIANVLGHVLKKSDRVDNAIVKFFVSAVKVACIIVLIAIILQMLGVQMPTIVTVLGAAGAAIALALRDSLANIAGGFMIIFTHPFSEGDIISVNENRGSVDHIDLFTTTLITPDYRTVTMPNGFINTAVVYNESNQELRRVDCEFIISFDSDVDLAKEILYRICQEAPLISMEKKPWIGISRQEGGTLVLECLAYCREGDQWKAKYYINEAVKKEFKKEGIDVPYPHVDVNLTK